MIRYAKTEIEKRTVSKEKLGTTTVAVTVAAAMAIQHRSVPCQDEDGEKRGNMIWVGCYRRGSTAIPRVSFSFYMS